MLLRLAFKITKAQVLLSLPLHNDLIQAKKMVLHFTGITTNLTNMSVSGILVESRDINLDWTPEFKTPLKFRENFKIDITKCLI